MRAHDLGELLCAAPNFEVRLLHTVQDDPIKPTRPAKLELDFYLTIKTIDFENMVIYLIKEDE